MRSEAVSPILNKVGQFLVSAPLRNVAGQKENTFRFRRVMDEGKIFLANLSKGRLGEDNCSLLGAMLVTGLELAALSRADTAEHDRRAFYVYVDEIHSFITQSFAGMLSESRKYNLNLTLAHQYIGQLDERIRAAILGNVGTIISFRLGAEDAEILAREFYPVFNQADLTNLPNHHIYLKLLIDGVTSKPFSAMTLLPPPKEVSYKREIIEASRRRYGRRKEDAIQDKPAPRDQAGTVKETRQGRLL
jgi:hypothetical protein